MIPCLAASSTPSANGKNASDATTEPASGSTAFIAPNFTESTRLICPAPALMACPRPSIARAYTMALLFTCFATFQPNSSAAHSSSVGARLVFDLRLGARQAMHIGRLRQESAADGFHDSLRRRRQNF